MGEGCAALAGLSKLGPVSFSTSLPGASFGTFVASNVVEDSSPSIEDWTIDE
jgi:hypothetical protein